MVNTFDWLRLISRVCILAILTGTLVYEFAGTRVQAATTCIQCDQNYIDGLDSCNAQRSSCISNCNTDYNACINAGQSGTCPEDYDACLQRCSNNYDSCNFTAGQTYDRCLGLTADATELCSVDYAASVQSRPYSGQGRTACDNGCRDDLNDCRANGGTSCGQNYNDCKVNCR